MCDRLQYSLLISVGVIKYRGNERPSKDAYATSVRVSKIYTNDTGNIGYIDYFAG